MQPPSTLERDADAPPPMVLRMATELPPDELQAEFARYGIPTGDAATRVNALQYKYDEEYDAGRREYDEYVRRQQMKKVKQEYDAAVAEMKRLEAAALVRDDKASTIVKQIEANAAPQQLVVRGISPLACCALLRAMRANTNVLTLDLSNSQLGDVVGEAVGKMLLKNKRLRGLDLGFNWLTPQSLGPLGGALKTNAVLTSLCLEANPIMANTASVTTVNSASASSSSAMQASHGAAMAAFESFMAAVALNATLTSLNLFQTHMTFDVSRALARALESNAALVALEVGGNSITQSDTAAIACKVRKNQLAQAAAQEKHALIRHEIRQTAEEIHVQHERQAKQHADAAWHEANARQRAEQREREDWARARARAEEDVRVAMEIEAQQKKYLQQIAEKKSAKGRK